MHHIEEQELLRQLAYESWLQRGSPLGSPEVDWERAKQLLADHRSQSVAVLNLALTRIQAEGGPPQSVSSALQAKTSAPKRRAYRAASLRRTVLRIKKGYRALYPDSDAS